MKRTVLVLSTCSALIFAAVSVCLAQAAKPAEKAAPAAAMSMKPAPEMDRAKWMVGTWQCTGKAMASEMGPEHPTEAQVVIEMALDDHWLQAHYREKKTAQNPMPISGDEAWSYDPAGKMWNRLAIDSMGGWEIGTAKGWEKGKMAFTSDAVMGGKKMKIRDTFTEKNPREIDYLGEMGTPDGKWTALWSVNCKK